MQSRKNVEDEQTAQHFCREEIPPKSKLKIDLENPQSG